MRAPELRCRKKQTYDRAMNAAVPTQQHQQPVWLNVPFALLITVTVLVFSHSLASGFHLDDITLFLTPSSHRLSAGGMSGDPYKRDR